MSAPAPAPNVTPVTIVTPVTMLDLAAMQHIIQGGTNPDYDATDTELAGLDGIGTRRLRLINVDDGSLLIGKTPWALNNKLAICRAHNWIPHIVIGQSVPAPLAITDPDGRVHSPTSWEAYDSYILQFLNYVVVAQGFSETEWEVGNEMSTPSANWVAATLPTSNTDPAGFAAYSTLYQHISTDVQAFRQQHPGVTLRVGGPADPVWPQQFAAFVAQSGLPADFISTHLYGDQMTGATFTSQIQALRQQTLCRSRSQSGDRAPGVS